MFFPVIFLCILKWNAIALWGWGNIHKYNDI